MWCMMPLTATLFPGVHLRTHPIHLQLSILVIRVRQCNHMLKRYRREHMLGIIMTEVRLVSNLQYPYQRYFIFLDYVTRLMSELHGHTTDFLNSLAGAYMLTNGCARMGITWSAKSLATWRRRTKRWAQREKRLSIRLLHCRTSAVI